MPQDLPGFYYDSEKNRYFPIKGPIPGTSRSSSSSGGQKSNSDTKPASKAHMRMGLKTARLLQVRELCGNVISSRKGNVNFQEQYQKIQASQPMIWKYIGTERIADGALAHLYADIDTPDGSVKTEILLTGGMNGSLSLYEVGNIGRDYHNGVKCIPDRVWPLNKENQAASVKAPGYLWSPAGGSAQMLSNISCINVPKQHNPEVAESSSSMQRAIMTTLGEETLGGSIYLINLNEPLEYGPTVPIIWRMQKITSFNSTVWTADCNSDGSQAVIGTNLGAAIVDMDTGRPSWICHCKSDFFSLQLDYSGNIVLCGLRNGAIVTVDIREKPEELSARLTRHRIPFSSHTTSNTSRGSSKKFTKQWFELKGNVYHSSIISMPSSISSLASLKLFDQYFIASSMDGSIKLYDRRLYQRGAIQSYEGNVNSHTRIQLGVDPSERFLVSGGEDSYLRVWSIKSGEMLFQDKFMNSAPSVVCWPGGVHEKMKRQGDDGRNHHSGIWFASQEGVFSVDY